MEIPRVGEVMGEENKEMKEQNVELRVKVVLMKKEIKSAKVNNLEGVAKKLRWAWNEIEKNEKLWKEKQSDY